MTIENDFSVAANGNIRYEDVDHLNYTVIALHRWLGDLMDNAAASGNDVLDITDATASERSTDNIITLNSPYNIDDTASQHLYDGSVIQSGGDTIYDGILIFANAGMYLDIVQNGAIVSPNFWTTGLNADAANGISHRFMLKVRTGGADIDGRRIIGQTREFGFTYSEFKINSTARGNNVMALTYATDLNNQTVETTVSGWSTITNTEGYRALDVDGNAANEYYFSEWNKDTYSINQFYERMKWLTRRDSSSAIYNLNGALFRGITHEIDAANPVGAFSGTGAITWVSGVGEMLAINHSTSSTKMWIQFQTGLVPTSGQLIAETVTSATIYTTSTTERTLSFPFCGVSTGAAIIGAYGFGIEPLDLTANDKLFDLTNTQRTPPNNVTFTVGGLMSGEDRILVGPAVGTALKTDQFTLAVALSGVETQVVVNSVIASDTPSAGTIRIELGSAIYQRIPYNSFASSIFYISSTNFSTDNASGNVYISYIDKAADAATAAFTGVYSQSGDRPLFIRVRDGGLTPIKTFETTGTLGAAGGGATAIRTPDV